MESDKIIQSTSSLRNLHTYCWKGRLVSFSLFPLLIFVPFSLFSVFRFLNYSIVYTLILSWSLLSRWYWSWNGMISRVYIYIYICIYLVNLHLCTLQSVYIHFKHGDINRCWFMIPRPDRGHQHRFRCNLDNQKRFNNPTKSRASIKARRLTGRAVNFITTKLVYVVR